MKRIGIVSDLVRRNEFSGMAIYISEMTKQLAADSRYEYFPVHLRPAKPPFEPISVQINSLSEIKKNKLDVMYYPNPPMPVVNVIPSVLTIPDLSFVYDGTFSLIIKFYLWFTYFLAAHSSKAITTFSTNSLKDIQKYLLVNPNKITIVTPFISNEFTYSKTRKRDIILCVSGTFVPRKNTAELLEAYANLPTDLKKKYKLVIVGKKDTKYFPVIEKRYLDLKLGNDVNFVGNVTRSEMIELYHQAVVLVCPSLYEGFGLPCLEAFTSGVPVIAYSNSSLSEIVESAGILVTNRRQLELSLIEILTSKTLQEKYRQAGFVRAASFSREAEAQKLLKLFDYVSIHS